MKDISTPDVEPITDPNEPAAGETQDLPSVDVFRATRKLTAAEAESPGAVDNARASCQREVLMLATDNGEREIPLNNSIDETETPDGVGGLTLEVTLRIDVV